MLRWIVHGIPRIPWESHSRFDGISENKLDKYGKIYEHKVSQHRSKRPTKVSCPSCGAFDSIHRLPLPKPTYFEFAASRMKNGAIAEVFGDQAFLYLGSYQFLEIQDRMIVEEHEASML